MNIRLIEHRNSNKDIKVEKQFVGYMHLIDGYPAHFKGRQICHWATNDKLLLRKTIGHIKKDLNNTIEFRNEKNYPLDVMYTHIKVYI